MSANNVVWVMLYKKIYHVFYSGCMDNTPIEPDYKDQYYTKYYKRRDGLEYAHNIVNKINRESYEEGFVGVEYGVCEITIEEEDTIEERVKRLETQLITKENEIKERLCVLEDEAKHTKNDVPERCKKCKALTDEGYCSSPTMCVKIYPFPAKHKDGCYQFTYCSECMAYPMGLGCPNIVKGPVQLKDEIKHGKQN